MPEKACVQVVQGTLAVPSSTSKPTGGGVERGESSALHSWDLAQQGHAGSPAHISLALSTPVPAARF